MDTTLTERWQALQQSQPKLRIRNAAEQLGVSEAELLATRLGQGVTRLEGDFRHLICEVEALGEVMALTRNDGMVHEKTGQYKDISLHGQMGLALGVIDLRLFFSRFVFGFAVSEDSGQGVRRSLQFFNAQGEAVHKIYATANTQLEQYQALVERYIAGEQLAPVIAERDGQTDLLATPAALDVAQLRQDWSELKDVHHFQAMLKKHQIERIPAYQSIGADYAQPLAVEAFEQALVLAADSQQPIMIFVGSDGVVQIHTGAVTKLLRTGDWFNVLDPGFNLHANTALIDQLWLVRKPTNDGIVTSLEAFDVNGRQLALMFGERHNGQPERDDWRQLQNQLLARFLLSDGAAA
ncbi:hemin-degrading factor [Bacterioplanes sanyensis]|uniref:Hemin-degrading factor n=1 Tax=Bacterioplanes sanyensis TaxID=1249553 RepID=A0A222FGZ2_9GAMM|nr:ChuX/HutX family heme-like substrate-binding protein [Bacterioplanes sanyensis]ASP38325.1 hemin-degrading factor [Bacterioplanes sanyensis]